MQITYRRIPGGSAGLCTGWENRHPTVHFRAAVVADLHDAPYKKIIDALRRIEPDLILVPGDLTEDLTEESSGCDSPGRPGLGFLSEAAAIAPTFYAWGNHETGAGHVNLNNSARDRTAPPSVCAHWLESIRKSGVVLLDQSYVSRNGLVLGGLRSGLLNEGRVPDIGWLDDFCRAPGYRILLCHHPEYYDLYLRDYPIDLFVSGHAHGGQWRLFGRGIFAPDQGLFPKYTDGIHEGRLVISRGLSNTVAPIPRLFNPRELVVVEVRQPPV
jgi:uncharacterized protein